MNTETVGVTLGVLLFSAATTVAGIAEHREAKWREYFDVMAAEAGFEPMRAVTVVPFKGCGWHFGETIYATTRVEGERAEIKFCRNRDGTGFFEIGTFTGGPIGERR